MYLRELTQEGIVDNAVIFRDTLNPVLWKNNRLKPFIRYKLLQIAKNFIDFIGIDNLNLKDITISGSNAAYTYTEQSDIDLHLIVDIPSDQEMQLKQLFDAKKNQYNFTRNIKIKGIDIELYVQGSKDIHHSVGIYSVLDDNWISEPKQERVNINDTDVENKVNNYISKINLALKSNSKRKLIAVKDDLSKIRKSGLEQGGEFSVENVAFKVLRAKGYIDKLRQRIREIEDEELSLRSL
jgi:hypothetical protein